MPIEIPTDLTPELVPLSWLIGTWKGQGRLGSGEADSEFFVQTATFSSNGLPYLEYRAESWLSDEDGNQIRPLSEEVGFWALDRALEDADVGPGLRPADIVPVLRDAEAVEEQRNAEGGFNITATITHPGGISELYYGTIKGPQIQLSTDTVLRGSGAKAYAAATRIFGLVHGDLYWRWDAAESGDSLEAHASAILQKVAPGPTDSERPE